MLSLNNTEKQGALSQFRSEFNNSPAGTFETRIKPGLQLAGTRCLYYHAPDNTLLVSHCKSPVIHLVNLTTGKIRIHNAHTRSVRKVTVFGDEIITAGWDATVRVADYQTLQQRLILNDPAMGRCPYVTVAAAGDYLVGFTYDSDIRPESGTNSIRVWSLKTGQLTGIVRNLGAPQGTLRSGACRVYRNRMYVISDSGHLSIFDLHTCRLLHRTFLSVNLRVMHIQVRRGILLAGDINGNVHVCRLSDGAQLYTVSCHRSDISTIRAHSDREDLLITTGSDGEVRFWELPDFSCEGVIECGAGRLWTQAMRKNILFAGSEEGHILAYDIHDLSNIKEKGSLIIHGDSLIVCQSGSSLFYADSHAAMEVVEKDSGKVLTGKQAEYLLSTYNSESVLREVFTTGDELPERKPAGERNPLQLIAHK